MTKVYVGSIIRDTAASYRIIYDFDDECLKLLNTLYETTSWSVPRKRSSRVDALTESEIKQLYGGCDSCNVSHITDDLGRILFPKAKTYKVGDRFVSFGETYILAAMTASKAVLINLRTGWRYDDGFDVDSLQFIPEDNIPAGFALIRE